MFCCFGKKKEYQKDSNNKSKSNENQDIKAIKIFNENGR